MSERAPSLLIVDDIDANRAILARRFERRGFETAEANCGQRALELLDQKAFDIVLLDVMMPDLDGLQVLKAGANDYVTKPVDFVVALARTKTQLALKRAEEASQRAKADLRGANEK